MSSEGQPSGQASGSNAPVKPPRPPNAWILYRSDKVKLLPGVAPGERRPAQGDVSKMIANMWKNEAEDIRAEYERRAEVRKLAHLATYPNYRFNPVKKEVKDAQRAEAKVRKETKRAEKLNRGRHNTAIAGAVAPATQPIAYTPMPSNIMPDLRYGPGGPSPPMSACSSPGPVSHLQLSDDNQAFPAALPSPESQHSPVQTLSPPLSQHSMASSRSSSYERAPPLSLQSPLAAEPYNLQEQAWNQGTHEPFLGSFENPVNVPYTYQEAENMYQDSVQSFMDDHGTSIFGMGTFDPSLQNLEGDLDIQVSNIGSVEIMKLPHSTNKFDQYMFLDPQNQLDLNDSYHVSSPDFAADLGHAQQYGTPSYDVGSSTYAADSMLFDQGQYAGPSSRVPSFSSFFNNLDYNFQEHANNQAQYSAAPSTHYTPPSGAAQSSRRRVGRSYRQDPTVDSNSSESSSEYSPPQHYQGISSPRAP